jgi:predicted nuclease with RNAse H fold
VLTVGIDLAAEPKRTAVAWVDWRAGRGVVREVRCGVDDDTLLAALAEADKAGIDSPLGWPDAFVEFVTAHHGGIAPMPAGYPEPGWRRNLTMRVTDQVTQEVTGLRPLSVSADLIGHVALRCAGLLSQLANGGHPVDRGGGGIVTEAYPAASLKTWGLPHRGYKLPRDTRVLGEIVGAITAPETSLDLGESIDLCKRRHDALDAVIVALTARAAAQGRTLRPRTAREAAAAVTEGWIAIPHPGSRLSELA